MVSMPPVVYTIGHSTRRLEEFMELLRKNGVRRVVDVRTMPRSKRNPQYNVDGLPASLAKAGIAYTHIAALGGLRRARPDSPNGGWRNASFRGYADYMQTAEFEAALGELVELARGEPCALMCAEAVPWRCHRSLVADALVVRGHEVLEILGAQKPAAHKLTPFARVEGLRITYPDLVPAPGSEH
jgi:uncharacterized protein (DUF488 family)